MKIPIGLALLLLVVAAPARAQEADVRWTPWLGCWQMLNERVRDGNPEGAEAVAAAGARPLGAASGVAVCVAPTSSPAAVTLTTRVGDEPVLEQTLAADGSAQSTTDAACTGTQRAEWSREGRRLFARAELTCAGQPARAISGLSTIASDGTWVDVQAMEVEGRTSVRVRRYQRADGPRRAGAPWTVEDVKEAAGKVSPTALEAALIESGARLRLSSRDLVELDEAEVPEGVIDLLVALSYPDRFQIDRQVDAGFDPYPVGFAGAEWGSYMGYGLGYPYFSWYPGYYGNYRYFYSPFGYGYGYGYSGLYGGYYPGGGLVTVPVDPDEPQASGSGRVVNGVGYTRVRPREAQTADSGDSGGGRSGTSSRGRATVGGYAAGGDSSSSGGSSGGSTSSGSGGASGGGGGRTAQPR